MYLSKPKLQSKEELYTFNCGHKIPSHESSSFEAYKEQIGTSFFEKKYTVKLNPDDSANLTKDSVSFKGKWTMVYDEGFEINLQNESSNSSYFAFSKYDMKSKVETSKLSKKINSKWISFCYSTLVGWFHEDNNWGCFYAIKDGHEASEVTNGEAENKLIVVENTVKLKDTELERVEEKKFLKPKESVFDNLTISFLQSAEKLVLSKGFKDHKKVISRLNNEHLSWRAKYYDEFEGMTIKDLNRFAGRRKDLGGFKNIFLNDYKSFRFKSKLTDTISEDSHSLSQKSNKLK